MRALTRRSLQTSPRSMQSASKLRSAATATVEASAASGGKFSLKTKANHDWKMVAKLFFIEQLSIKLVHQLNLVEGETYQYLLPQPSVGQFWLIKWALSLVQRWRTLAATETTRSIGKQCDVHFWLKFPFKKFYLKEPRTKKWSLNRYVTIRPSSVPSLHSSKLPSVNT